MEQNQLNKASEANQEEHKPFFQTVIAECFGPNRKFDVLSSWKNEFLDRHDVTTANLNSLQSKWCAADAVYDT